MEERNWRCICYCHENSTVRETKDAERILHSGPCLGVLEPGIHVSIRNVAPRGGPEKLITFWEQGIAKVDERFDNGVTYKVEPITEPGKMIILHRNMLMPINHVIETPD